MARHPQIRSPLVSLPSVSVMVAIHSMAAGAMPGVARLASRHSFANLPVCRSFHTTPAAAAPASAAGTAPSGKGKHLYVWGGGQGWRAHMGQTLGLSRLKSLFGGGRSSSPTKSSSPLHATTLRPAEVASPDGTGFRDMSFGHAHGAFVTGAGAVYTYGSGRFGQLGHGAVQEWVDEPQRVEGLPPAVQVTTGKYHTLVLTEDGEIYSFGRGSRWNTASVLGTADTTDAVSPRRVLIDGSPRIVQISSGSVHSMARSEGGQVYGFGQGQYGRLGTGGSGAQATPVLLQALAAKRITHITCGSSFNGALDEQGNVYTWGRNEKGQLGLGPGLSMDQYAMESVPTRVEFIEEEGSDGQRVPIARLAAGYKHMLALSNSRQLYTWGNSLWMRPQLLRFNERSLQAHRFELVGGGEKFNVAADADGCLATWGSGHQGCLGHGSKDSRQEPTFVKGFGPSPSAAGLSDKAKPEDYFGRVERILAGYNHCAVLTSKK